MGPVAVRPSLKKNWHIYPQALHLQQEKHANAIQNNFFTKKMQPHQLP
jgi:hypothetical protein